ncbi:20648_t:CDS:2, partial [Funneliformis geosporum]
ENEFHELEDNLERGRTETFPTEPILGLDLKELDYTQYPFLTSPIELYIRIKFYF